MPLLTKPSRLAAAAAVTLALLVGSTVPAPAQYFGRNKIQYRTFDFRILRTHHFDVYYYPEEEAAAREGARMAERWYTRLSTIFDHQFEQRQPFIFYASHPHFQQTSTSQSAIGEGTGGFTEAFKQRVVMPFTFSLGETDHVVGHELVHAFQYDISGLGRAGGGIEAAARRFQVPLWFMEGMAEYLSLGPVDPHTAMWVRDAALRGELPDIERMTYDPRIFPYRWGQALWAYIGGRWGDAAIGQILKLAGDGVPYPDAFDRVLNISLEALSADWHTSIRRAYLPMLAERPEAREVARPLITRTRDGGRMNLAPVLSPDGRWVAFLSELDFIDVELWLANAETGEIVRRLQKGSISDPHFASLRYINSAGTFSPGSDRFAFSALRSGQDVLVVLDVQSAQRLMEIEIDGVDEIMSPSWSPDGRSIVFTGLSGGFADLYIHDLESGETTRLTDDPYTELQPAWSPDGRWIAFSTDRGPQTRIEELEYGPYRIAMMDAATREITILPDPGGRKHINPSWSRDGGSLYFISDVDGISNIYRIYIGTGALFQVTNVFTGVSGITAMSPAITTSRWSDRLLFAAFEANGYNIYSLSRPDELAGTPMDREAILAAASETPAAAVLPPIPRPTETAFNRVSRYLDAPEVGLPPRAMAAAWETVDYSPRLGLDYLGQPQVGATIGGPFGAGVYGGVAGIFSDVLGRHTVFGAIQAQGQIEEIGGVVQYINSEHRWNYGLVLQRIPYVYGLLRQGFSGDVFLRQIIRARLFDSAIQGFAQYPITPVNRFEVGGGVRRIATDQQIYEVAFDASTGAFLGESIREQDGFAVNLVETSVALVYDNALFGYTSPFTGQRYRFQLSPTFGQLNFVHALADYRRYFWLRPFTLAVRGLHSGRYGRDSEQTEDGRQIFRDLYLGYPWYVRGYYDTYSGCRESGGVGQDCQILGQLFGSRLAVATAEVRFPLIRQLTVGTSLGLPPIEGFIFGDAGMAWGADSQLAFEPFPSNAPSNETDNRYILTSGGVGARVNLFGYMIIEIDYVNGFQRDRGWHWQFNFQPGF